MCKFRVATDASQRAAARTAARWQQQVGTLDLVCEIEQSMSDPIFPDPKTVVRLSDYTARPRHAQAPLACPELTTLASVLALNAVLMQRIIALQRALDSKFAEGTVTAVRPVIAKALDRSAVPEVVPDVRPRIAGLTPKQMQVLTRMLAGQPNRTIAADLGISRRTVENHRAAIMQRSGATSLPALARMAVGLSADGDSH